MVLGAKVERQPDERPWRPGACLLDFVRVDGGRNGVTIPEARALLPEASCRPSAAAEVGRRAGRCRPKAASRASATGPRRARAAP